MTNLWALTPEQGGDTLVYIASSPEVAKVSGEYFYKRAIKRPSGPPRDVEAQERLWRETAETLGLELYIAPRSA